MNSSNPDQQPDSSPSSLSQIQRLVDGQLSMPERQEVLLHIEHHHPTRWRDLALGFVESQIMAEALEVSAPAPARCEAAVPLSFPFSEELSSATPEPTSPDATMEPLSSSERQLVRTHSIGLALAACLAIGLLLGWLISDFAAQNSDKATASAGLTEGTRMEPARVSPGPGLASLSELPHFGTLEFAGSNRNDFAMPVVDATRPGTNPRHALEASRRPMQKLQDRYEESGYESSLQTSYITARLKDGRKLVIPINQVVFEQP